MAELKAKSPCDGLLPIRIGAAELTELDPGVLSMLSPLGDRAGLGAALERAHGMTLPDPLRATGGAGARCIWFGRDQVLLMGSVPDTTLTEHAAVVDQSDGWAVVQLEGAAAVDVLARLVPVDLRADRFARDHTLRTQLFHMSASITRTGDDRFMILVFRSMASTLVHDIKTAMEAVRARAGVRGTA
ncbi:sarcosine oxidase subunit gamma [Sulfitobacter alexandrii]|uniref:Sarcosine oxidase subunit gamma n=1 Tax=Sulfitobacter alexandrii TaxID=1917485 RepID=A0A1J0WIG2_9RHOB|nr:sarcosine oxidase subunit gamma [Sulfitobacter alexandrii]APE44099.1 sarcosine oxidase subunit gamma [Sulfitobacter alexandrii]